MNTNKKAARVAGIFYFLYFIIFIFANSGERAQLTAVAESAASSTNQIAASEGLFRAAFVTDLVAALFFLLSAWALYRLLKQVDQSMALLLLVFNLAGVAVQCASLMMEFAALQFSGGAAFLSVFPAEQRQALAMLFLHLHKNGFMICQLFFGAWLFPLGYLVYKSGFLPKWLGILLMLDGVGIVFWFFQFFLLPGYPALSYPGMAVSFVAEVSLCLWLLIMGAKEPGPVAMQPSPVH